MFLGADCDIICWSALNPIQGTPIAAATIAK